MSPAPEGTRPRAGGAGSAERAPLTELAGVGPARAAALARLGLGTVRDLLTFPPRQLEEVGPRLPLAEAREALGRRVSVGATVASVRLVRGRRRRSVVRVRLVDDTGELAALFFNQPWVRERLQVGQAVELEGRVVDSRGPALAAPRLGSEERPLPAPGTLLAVYPAVRGLGQSFLRGLVSEALERFGPQLEEVLGAELRARLDLPGLPEAVASLHAPSTREAFERARRRLALEPLFELQARIHARRAERDRGRARALPAGARRRGQRLARLPHAPTPGQLQVLDDLDRDLARRIPMRRLLQGDVGSGKTLCGLYAALAAAEAGGQTAFMAPTELLAEQHHYGSRELLARAGLRCALLTGSVPAAARRGIEAELERGALEVVFGTHALFSDGVSYRSLALAVVDEQHRFGVSQRRRLFDKGRDVHVLLMTATPIPRSLALTVYGHLDVSVLRGLPPGRGELTTRRIGPRQHGQLAAELAARLEAGESVFWVCPRIESTPSGRGAREAHARIAAGPFGRHGVELVHGRLSAAERVQRLERFRAGRARVLVGTTVVEVGVDVPRATAMVIEGAERFGLAQLHQLRGRVGRGARASVCYLLGPAGPAPRLDAIERTRDGFRLAERDLAERGMGDLVGLRQAGENLEGLGPPALDLELLLFAREVLAGHPELRRHYLERARARG